MKEIAITRRGQTEPAGSDHTTLVLDVVGPITHRTAHKLRDALRRLGPPSPTRHLELHLDLTCCTQIDLDGLLALKVAQDEVSRHGGALHLIEVPPLIRRQIRQHNFDDLMPDEPDDDDRE